jgi:Aminoacyl-tRNA editing domain
LREPRRIEILGRQKIAHFQSDVAYYRWLYIPLFVRKNGRPFEDFATRANTGAALKRITPASARIYEILHHPEAFTVQTIAAAEHIKGRHHAKVVMVKSGGQHLMTVLPADHRADLQKLEKIAGEQVPHWRRKRNSSRCFQTARRERCGHLATSTVCRPAWTKD